ncbi:Kiwa anti-phage protein KwaB-like domain-containing protein [Tumebacillus avium]|uniref:Kiwa anti-phage protein KwaB-like domain-containing protein n=1 Tax=Tumebacillus avium TaxID=1903704 RepID=UPI0012FE04F4|nr:Kiwa anti-phage protein KwaB-like domain-containing protein [Tumebacillus avium]
MEELIKVKNECQNIKMKYLVRVRKPDTNEYVAFNVPLANDMPMEIKDLILDSIIQKVRGLDCVPFNPTITEVGMLECLPVSEVNNYDNIHAAVTSTFSESVSELDFDDIWGYCICIRYGNNSVKEAIFFKKFAYPKVLKQSILMTIVGDVYNKLDSDIVTVDNETHAFSLNNILYILNKGQFERFFNYSSSYQKVVTESIETLKELDVIENFDVFVGNCLNSDTLTRRLVKIITDERFETLKRNMHNVQSVVDDFSLNVKLEGGKIVYDEDSPVSDIITLIRGACVIGALDKEKYLASDTKVVEAR